MRKKGRSVGSSSSFQDITIVKAKLSILIWILGIALIPLLGYLGWGTNKLIEISEKVGTMVHLQAQVNRTENRLLDHLQEHKIGKKQLEENKIDIVDSLTIEEIHKPVTSKVTGS